MEFDALDHAGLPHEGNPDAADDPDLQLVEITTYEIGPEKASVGKRPE